MFEEQKALRLFPLFPCLPIPDGHLIFTLNGPTHLVAMVANTDSAVIWGKECHLQVWSLSTYRVIHQLGEPLSPDDIHISTDGRGIYHTMGTRLVGWSTESGNMSVSVDILPENVLETVELETDDSYNYRRSSEKEEPKLLTTMGVSVDGNYVAVRINHNELLVDGCGLVIVDVKLGKVICTTGEGCCGKKIPVVRFLDATNIFYAAEQKCEKEQENKETSLPEEDSNSENEMYWYEEESNNETEALLVKFDVQSLETHKVILNKKYSVFANVDHFMPSTILRTDKQELIITCMPDDIVIVSIETWEVHYPKLQPGCRKQRGAAIYNGIVAFALLSSTESSTLSYNSMSSRTVIKILDSEYNYEAVAIQQGPTDCSPIDPTTFHVCTEYRLAFVGYSHVGRIDIWNLHPQVRCIIYSLDAHAWDVTTIYFVPSTRLLYTSSHNDTIKVWDTTSFLTSFYQQHGKGQPGEMSGSMEEGFKQDQTIPENESQKHELDTENTTQKTELDMESISIDANTGEFVINMGTTPDATIKETSKDVNDINDSLREGQTIDNFPLHSNLEVTYTTTVREVLVELEEIEKVSSGVTDLVFTRDGRHMYTCYEDKLPLAWDHTSGKIIDQVISTDTSGENVLLYFNFVFIFFL